MPRENPTPPHPENDNKTTDGISEALLMAIFVIVVSAIILQAW